MSDQPALSYCPDLLNYQRRMTREVMAGDVGIGGDNPVRVQSMITADTRDTAACVAEIVELAGVGCEIVRVTAQTRLHAANLEHIARGVRAAGCLVPLVADIHFKPDAALEAAKWVEKVRVNPGNFADKKKFEIREYSDEQYEEELERIRGQFIPLVRLCKDLGRAIRVGTNHGSLSDRIMNRYGDTPLGMVESALEFARIAREEDYHELVFSMKASNPKVMIEAYRLLVARLAAEGADWNYPIHLGVTEAGDGEDGRIKSAIGIGSLLADGIGDTIRVSLTEDSVHEIPVARELVERVVACRGESGWSVPLQSVGGASRPALLGEDAAGILLDWERLSLNTSSYLPHWRIPGATYAVTFRLVDSLPKGVIAEYREKREILAKRLAQSISSAGSRNALEALISNRQELAGLYERTVESALQQGSGACHLDDPEVAAMVVDALRYFEGERYELLAWSVMPNHVHVIVKPAAGHELEEILHSWKSFTAKEANRLLGRKGSFWQDEYYDHVIRDGDDLRRQVRYVLLNPDGCGASRECTGSKYGATWDEVLAGAGRSGNGLGQDAQATFERPPTPAYDPFSYQRRGSETVRVGGREIGGGREVGVFATRATWDALAHKLDRLGDYRPEIVFEDAGVVEIDPRDDAMVAELNARGDAVPVSVADGLDLDPVHAFRLLAMRVDPRHPVLLKDMLAPPVGQAPFLAALIDASVRLGSLLCDGIGDAVLVRGEPAPGQSIRLAYNILQAAGARIFKTDYVACPSCGRTLFNLQTTTRRIREATGHLKGVRIAVMGCIVNGPGEMADADFGYVGGAPGKINLYVGKTAVRFNIPEDEAVDRLIDLMREHGRWIDPPAAVGSAP